ncbi:MAG: hypothetical protein JWO91_3558 [Acidobacteriaceae bacterium]|nr:hypothetical protein [Acidobacteriaceae bacterium]
MENRVYTSVGEYPDAEMNGLVSAAATMSGESATAVLEDFGAFIVAPLMQIDGYLILREWRTLDVIGKTEETIHTIVREHTPGARPPVLHTIRRSVDELVLIYGSPANCAHLPSASPEVWQDASTRALKLPRPSACTRARPIVKLSSARDRKSRN